MADGGEGTVDALLSACDGQKVTIALTGPLPNQRCDDIFRFDRRWENCGN